MPEDTNPIKDQTDDNPDYPEFDPEGGAKAMQSLVDSNKARFQGAKGGSPAGKGDESEPPGGNSKGATVPAEPGKGSKAGGAGEWLVEGKFRNDAEGVKAMLAENKYLQAEKDRLDSDNRRISAESKDGMTLIQAMKQDKEFANALKVWIESRTAGVSTPLMLKEPALPEDADPLELLTPGTSANKYFLEARAYDRELGKRDALKALSDFREEQTNAGKIQEDERKERSELKKMGLKEEDIDAFYAYMDSPQHQTLANAVAAWRALDSGAPKLQPQGAIGPQPKNKPPSAAAQSGTVVQSDEPIEEVKKRVMAGILRHSKGAIPDPFEG